MSRRHAEYAQLTNAPRPATTPVSCATISAAGHDKYCHGSRLTSVMMMLTTIMRLRFRDAQRLCITVSEQVDRTQAAFRISVAIDLVVLLVLIE